jgi:hypothetical protein
MQKDAASPNWTPIAFLARDRANGGRPDQQKRRMLLYSLNKYQRISGTRAFVALIDAIQQHHAVVARRVLMALLPPYKEKNNVNMKSCLLFLRATLLFTLALENGDSKDHDSSTPPPAPTECGVFLAESTIAHAGLGMYAGKDFHTNDVVTSGDIMIPIFEMDKHNKYNRDSHYFVWDDYIWDTADFLHMQGEEVKRDEIAVASPGLGAAVNCRISMVNVESSWNKIDNAGLHRSTSPGAGAITPYHDRQGIALQDIAAGEELYTMYGESYFKSRTSEYGQVPGIYDFKKADKLVAKAISLLPENCASDMARDLVNLMGNIPFRSEHSQRLMNAFPTNATSKQLDVICKEGTGKQYQTVRDLNWLQTNGRCMDNIRAGPSTIPHAGRGAFATRFIPKGHVVAPAPLIHIVDKKRLLMYDDTDSKRGGSTHRYTNSYSSITVLVIPIHLFY